jgi:hypothetical protein
MRKSDLTSCGRKEEEVCGRVLQLKPILDEPGNAKIARRGVALLSMFSLRWFSPGPFGLHTFKKSPPPHDCMRWLRLYMNDSLIRVDKK